MGGRYQRRSRDAANDGNFDLSTLVPGVVIGSVSGATIRSVAGLIAGVSRYNSRVVRCPSCRSRQRQSGGLASGLDQGEGGETRVGIVSALIGLPAAFEQSVGRFTPVTVSGAA